MASQSRIVYAVELDINGEKQQTREERENSYCNPVMTRIGLLVEYARVSDRIVAARRYAAEDDDCEEDADKPRDGGGATNEFREVEVVLHVASVVLVVSTPWYALHFV